MFYADTMSKDIKDIVAPLIDVIDSVVPVLIALVVAIGAIYCIILGVKFAKADDPQEHEKAKNALKYAIIGFILIFVLLIMLNIGARVFNEYYTARIDN